MTALLGHAGRTGWDEWLYVVVPLALFALTVGGLGLAGRPGEQSSFLMRHIGRIPAALRRITGLPGWVAATIATGIFALLVAVIGFYWDVAWHIDFGRDKELFTPAHTMIVAGLLFIVGTAIVEIVFASIEQADVGIRWKSLRIPYSALPLAGLGVGALSGFPLDDLWHHFYGVDVTMWGPTHLIMIAGASFTPVALWLVLAEARIAADRSRVARLTHVVLAVATLTGLSTFQGEFDFGVPQFQLLYHPVLVTAAAAGAFVAARLVLGTGGALITAIGFIALRAGLAALVGPALGLTSPEFPLYLAPAVGVEVAGLLWARRQQLRFALASGVAVGTLGLAGEWAAAGIWGDHPWTGSLLPHAASIGLLGAVSAAVLGAALVGLVVDRPFRIRPAAVGLAGLGVAVALLLPFPRTSGAVHGRLSIEPAGRSYARVQIQLDPPDAASGARWFETIAWQGGGLRLVPMKETGPGQYVAPSPVPVTSEWKTLVRLHRGSDMMAVPVYMPADPEIRARAIPLGDRTALFVRDTELLMRESHGGPRLLAAGIFGTLFAIVAIWIGLMAFAARRVSAQRREEPREPSPYPQGSSPPRMVRAGT